MRISDWSSDVCSSDLLEARLVQVFGEVLGHALGERGDQGAHAPGGDVAALADEVVDLALGRADDADRVDAAGRADYLPDEAAAGLLPFPTAARCRDIVRLRVLTPPFPDLHRQLVREGMT